MTASSAASGAAKLEKAMSSCGCCPRLAASVRRSTCSQPAAYAASAAAAVRATTAARTVSATAVYSAAGSTHNGAARGAFLVLDEEGGVDALGVVEALQREKGSLRLLPVALDHEPKHGARAQQCRPRCQRAQRLAHRGAVVLEGVGAHDQAAPVAAAVSASLEKPTAIVMGATAGPVDAVVGAAVLVGGGGQWEGGGRRAACEPRVPVVGERDGGGALHGFLEVGERRVEDVARGARGEVDGDDLGHHRREPPRRVAQLEAVRDQQLGGAWVELLELRVQVREQRLRGGEVVRVGAGERNADDGLPRLDGDAQLEEAVGPREHTGALHEEEDVALAHVVLQLAQVAQVVRVEEDPLLEEAFQLCLQEPSLHARLGLGVRDEGGEALMAALTGTVGKVAALSLHRTARARLASRGRVLAGRRRAAPHR
eukprot:scaffold48959_cov64-Phaeocystis_antarctica.AAC.2